MGLLVQIQLLNLIFFTAILTLFIILDFKRFKRTGLGYLASGLVIYILIAVGNIILFDLRNNFLISNKLSMLIRGDTGFYTGFNSVVISILNTFSFFVQQLLLPFIYSYSPFTTIFIICFIFLLIIFK